MWWGVGNRSLKGLDSLEPVVCDACEQRCQRGDLTINFGGMLILPIRAETIGDVLDDSPIWPAAFQRFEHFVEALDSAFGARKCAFFFKARSGRQHHVGEMAAVTEENILHHQKLQLCHSFTAKD